VATRISGSSDLYKENGRLPINSINYVTCHDGFTLYDQVSYNKKYNEANGEDNRDGTDDNLSWNCGYEGETDIVEVNALRLKQAKNYIAILLLSQGVPMILSGDEVLRTQRGNNNAYAQDNEISWFDWTLVDKNRDMFRFVKQMIAFRKRHPCLMRRRFLTGLKGCAQRFPDVSWYGKKLDEKPWTDPDGLFLAFTLAATHQGEEDLHIILNMSEEPVLVDLPDAQGLAWFRAIDTDKSSPGDIHEPLNQKATRGKYLVHERCIVVFESRLNDSETH
jgi:isoamylase